MILFPSSSGFGWIAHEFEFNSTAASPQRSMQNHTKIPVLKAITEEEKMTLHHPRRYIDWYKRLYISGMTEIVDIVILSNDEAVMRRHPADDGAVDFSDDGTFIASQLFVGFGPGYNSLVTIRTGMREFSSLLSIRDIGDEIVFLSRIL